MSSDEKVTLPAETAVGSDKAPDKAGIELTKEIFHLLSHAVTSLKLYPSHHATVVKFVDELYVKVRDYFADREELEVDVQEHAFLMGGETVYKEEHLAKSLPYLFHKDGMQKFAILKDIDKQELRDLLDVIRATSLLPLDESDVVISIWEKDFPNIRIFAPDEYLLAKIDIFNRQPFDVFVDKQKLYTGQIELSPEDLKDVQSRSVSMGLMEQEEGKDYAELVTTIEDEFRDLIEFMLARARESPPEIEFHDMIFELLSLEVRPERVVPILGFLERHHRELLQDGKFSHAVHFLRQTHELKHLFSEEHPEKAVELDKFLNEIRGGRNIDLIREAIERKNFDSLSALFDYLGFFGLQSVPLVSELLDETQEPGTRRAAMDYLEEISQDNIEILANQLQDGKPAITRQIIAMLGRNPSKKALSFLAILSTYTNKEVKLAAVDTLGSSSDSIAQRILLTFVQDSDEDVGAAAAGRLRWPGDEDILKRTIKMISARQFRWLEPKRKIAIMSFLVRTGAPEALEAVRRAMQKRGLFARADRQITRLCAVEALAGVGTPEALEIMRLGLKSSNKKISEASRSALEKASRPAAPEPNH
jgi:HEAT repeat protein